MPQEGDVQRFPLLKSCYVPSISCWQISFIFPSLFKYALSYLNFYFICQKQLLYWAEETVQGSITATPF